jgi:hypothetical protein
MAEGGSQLPADRAGLYCRKRKVFSASSQRVSGSRPPAWASSMMRLPRSTLLTSRIGTAEPASPAIPRATIGRSGDCPSANSAPPHGERPRGQCRECSREGDASDDYLRAEASVEQTELTPSQEIIKFFNSLGGSPTPLETFEGRPKSFDCQRPFRVWCGRRRTSGVLLVSMLLNSRRMWL